MINDRELNDKKVKQLIHSLGLKYNLRDEDVLKIVNSPYVFTRSIISNLDLEDINSQEDLDKIKTNFIYSNLGKFYITYEFMKKLFRMKEIVKNRVNNKKNEEER